MKIRISMGAPNLGTEKLAIFGFARRLNPDFPSDKREGSRSSGTSRTDENADSWPKTALFLALWLILLGGGLTRLYVFSNTRASVRRHRCAPGHDCSNDRSNADAHRFLHPHCRCSEATVGELGASRRSRGQGHTLVAFVNRPACKAIGRRGGSGHEWPAFGSTPFEDVDARSQSVSGENLGPTFSTTLLASSFSTVALPQTRTWAMPMGGQPFWRIWPRRESSPTAVLAVR